MDGRNLIQEYLWNNAKSKKVYSVKEAALRIHELQREGIRSDVLIYRDDTWFAVALISSRICRYYAGYRYKNNKEGITEVVRIPNTLYLKSNFQLKQAVRDRILHVMAEVGGLEMS